ncbi:hypothetical protein PsAD2_03878 [Pseudovibrio axinellae]|uniref:Uncharacterized protein n=1 Tax=Pseudovibrio axinellae TaxID=989403 RepID=A0A161V3R3_9HYPH|nr:hypothetical protein [Pseudovibrio axinellae]KZL12572.1 hypothetical protein PsAD2_03878 [Pseudovibrio axinellae]SEP66285.1 hypothetical protein SAMN05421798_101102 [Pseudovibrio axinellae]
MAELIEIDRVPEIFVMEYGGNYYLVRGAAYLDQILFGKEALEIPILIQSVNTWEEVLLNWENTGGSMPWILNPGIVERMERDNCKLTTTSFNA